MTINIQQVSKPMGLVPRPLTFNLDNTVSVTLALVTIEKVTSPNDEGQLIETVQCNPTGQQTYHQLTADEGLAMLNVEPHDDESRSQAIDRAIVELLRAKGAINL